MGIERFFSSIEENKITSIESEFTETLKSKIDASYLFVDFNSIVYITVFKILADLNYVLYKIITDKTDRRVNNKLDKILSEYKIDIKNIKPKEFRKKFNGKNLDNIVVDEVEKYILNSLLEYINNDKLKYFYIAIDGVPSKSKMIEQKKRRYMGAFTLEYKKKIFKKYENELKKDDNRYTYEKNKISWGTYNITPGTPFMDKMDKMLSSKKFIDKIKSKCKNLKTYKYSGPYVAGEGENKIVNELRSGNIKLKPDNYLIYSPDSDVTLLSLLLNCKHDPLNKERVSKLKLIRHNQQKNSYDIVDIDKLSTNIYVYINKNIKINYSPDKDNCINDVVFLLTIFGNDFLPKIESYNVKYDFDRIIDKYIETLTDKYDGKYKYIVDFNYNDKKKVINQKSLLDVLNKLQKDEGANLQKVYMSSNYQNFNKLKKILGADQENFTEILAKFLSNLRHFNKDVRNLNSPEIIKKWIKDEKFIEKLKRLSILEGLKGINPTTVRDDNFITTYKEHYNRHKKLPKVRVTFRQFSKTIDDNFHKNKLEKSLDNIDTNLNITEYDRELYKFENMLDEYKDRLNSESINIGYISVNPNDYTIKTEKIKKGVRRYYNKFFGLSDLHSSKLKDISKTYLRGLVWVFDYYFNHHNIEYHQKYADILYYPYNHSPLVKQIYDALKDNEDDYLKKTQERVEYSKVNRSDYFNTLEQMMYVTPVQIFKSLVPSEYENFVNKSNYYPDLKRVVDEVWNDLDNNQIDCRGVIFLSKCHLKVIDNIQDFDKDRKFINTLRNIKLSVNTKSRLGNYKYNYDKQMEVKL